MTNGFLLYGNLQLNQNHHNHLNGNHIFHYQLIQEDFFFVNEFGITEETDADAIVVSEETGNISFVKGGVVTPISNINELKLLLGAAMGEE